MLLSSPYWNCDTRPTGSLWIYYASAPSIGNGVANCMDEVAARVTALSTFESICENTPFTVPILYDKDYILDSKEVEED